MSTFGASTTCLVMCHRHSSIKVFCKYIGGSCKSSNPMFGIYVLFIDNSIFVDVMVQTYANYRQLHLKICLHQFHYVKLIVNQYITILNIECCLTDFFVY